jgi:uncharacterized protein YkwD
MARSSFFLAVALALPLASIGCGGSTECDCGMTPGNPLDAQENAIVQDLNLLRMKDMLPAVTVCKSLDNSAAGHSDDMRNNGYLSDVAPSGSDVRSRACSAMYAVACGTTIPMGELVAEGNSSGDQTFQQWAADPMASPILTNPQFLVVGLGHSIGVDNQYWTLDLAADQDPSCN